MADLVFAIGDIEGCDDLLEKMENRIYALLETINAKQPMVVTMGDYVDRGPESCSVIERLRHNTFAGIPLQPIIGNHDLWFVRVISMFKANNPSWRTWLRDDTFATIRSYGVAIPDNVMSSELKAASMMREFAECVPQEHIHFIEKQCVPIYHAAGTLFVHAGLNPAYTINAQGLEDCVNGVKTFFTTEKNFGAPVCVGHTVRKIPYLNHSKTIIGVDTGAHTFGILTGAIIAQSRGLFQFFAVCNMKRSTVLVIIDDPSVPLSSLSCFVMWWRDVLAATDAKPYLVFSDKARLDTFAKQMKITKANVVSSTSAIRQSDARFMSINPVKSIGQ